ncbi:MAG: hypothetical protein QM664_13610 [Flavihumibacter sp.]
MPVTAALVKVSGDGYQDAFFTFTPRPGEEAFTRIRLRTREVTGQVTAADGGTVSNTAGARVIIPAASVVRAADNTAFSGQINLDIRSLENTDATLLPGDGRGTDTEGYLKALRWYGAVAVQLSGSDGKALQIAEGKTALLQIPIQASDIANAPATIGLWSFNESIGLWNRRERLLRRQCL